MTKKKRKSLLLFTWRLRMEFELNPVQRLHQRLYGN